MSGTTCIAIGVLSTASSRVTTYFTKKKPGNDVANSAVVSKASSWLGVFFPACGACAVVLSVF